MIPAILARTSALALMILGGAAAAETEPKRFTGATGGIVRSPHDLQPHNDGNLFGEAWVKLAYEVHRTERSVTALYGLGNFVADTTGFAYNNTAKIGFGVTHSVQYTDALNVTYSARYDWHTERHTGVDKSGLRLAADYYYYKRWEGEEGNQMFGLPKAATVFKSYGTLAYPGSLELDDNNVVVVVGGEYSADLELPDTDWLLTPFADFDLSWDKDRNNYNNKVAPSIGVKMRYPLEGGEIFGGVRLAADFRPIDDTFDTGPQVFFGWYKGF